MARKYTCGINYSQGVIYELRKSGLLSHLFTQDPSDREREQKRKIGEAGDLRSFPSSHSLSRAEVQLVLPDHGCDFLLISGFRIWGSGLEVSANLGEDYSEVSTIQK